MNHYDNENVIY